MQTPRPVQPVNPLPPAVIALALFIILIEIIFTLGARGIIGGPGAVGWRNIFIQTYGFNSDILRWMVAHNSYPMEHLQRLFTYAFIHGSFTHALVATVMLLALGKFVAESMGQKQFLVLFIVSAVVGAVTYGACAGAAQPWLIGAYPGIYGLIGGFTCVIWLRLGETNAPQLMAFRMIGFLMAFQLIFGALFGGGRDWIADLGGFATGFVLSFVLVPGGWARVLDRLRNAR